MSEEVDIRDLIHRVVDYSYEGLYGLTEAVCFHTYHRAINDGSSPWSEALARSLSVAIFLLLSMDAIQASSSRTFGERRTDVSRYIHTTRRLLSQLLVVVDLVKSKSDVLVALADTRQLIQRRQAEVNLIQGYW